MSKKFPFPFLPCADEINTAFHRLESLLNAMAAAEETDYVQDSFTGPGSYPSAPRFTPPSGAAEELWGNICIMDEYQGGELYYGRAGAVGPDGVIALDAQAVPPSALVSISGVWRC
jgi:hypothetical protein